eukprot:TRINITY_DN1869_c0_g1_i1.p1 TRINITY_DN1869_c0_g1~~TRINITY_DN1869_c0_g1_i1.p1  ORF type:complete len:412 (+),score=65.25 TRINITY_DN1869_c0_g1_i1:291-1526(+)
MELALCPPCPRTLLSAELPLADCHRLSEHKSSRIGTGLCKIRSEGRHEVHTNYVRHPAPHRVSRTQGPLRCSPSACRGRIRKGTALIAKAGPVAAPSGASEDLAAAAVEGISLALPPPAVRLPKSIRDISNGDHILGFGAQLSEGHPGFHDEEYKRRRAFIADLAKQHVIGEPVPHVEYTPAETATWAKVLSQLTQLYPTHACSEYLAALPLFDFRADRIPQLQDLSDILVERTGWRIRPVAGLLHPRDFLNGLAFKYFHSTQYIRHGGEPMYTPEPDICHELLGHVPMLADPAFGDLAQAIGVASLGASEKDIWHLTKLYWYTVEFGTVLEGSSVKAFGAGLLSSYGELEWMLSGGPHFLPLDPFARLPKMSYKDGFQKTYFLCPSFADVAEKLKAYARSIQRADVVAFQ